MASAAGLTLREPILPLKASFKPDSLRTTKVEHSWTTTAGQDKYYKMYLPVCDDPTNKEVLLYVIDQFLDAAHNDRLHLSNGATRYSKFRQVVDGSLRLDWQTLSDDRANQTVDSFTADVHALIALYMAPSSRDDQLAYLRHTSKPFQVEVAELSARLSVINRLGRWLPGSWTTADHTMHDLFADDTEKKRQLFQLMPMPWRVAFAVTTRQLDDNGYTYSQLTQFFLLQDSIEKNTRGKKRSHDATSSSGGRGRGQGGRGRGRGQGGRGYAGYGGGRGFNRGQYRVGIPNQGYGYYGQQPVPRVSHSPSPRRRPMVRGGRGPQIPQFMADQYYEQAAPPQDQYYESAGQEAYYDGGYDDSGDYQEQYYGGEEQDQGYDYGGDDQYYEDQGGDQGDGDAGGQGDEPPEDHFLQDFGY